MAKETKNGLIALVAIVLLVGAYFVGKSSPVSNMPQEQSTSTVSNVVSQTAPTQEVAPSNVANALTAKSANGLACKNIANAAASLDDAKQKQTDPYGSVTVQQTHYNQSLGNCYYVLIVVGNGIVETDLKAAPDDTMLAWCADISSNGQTSTICNEPNHHGLETEQRLQQLESQYLNN